MRGREHAHARGGLVSEVVGVSRRNFHRRRSERTVEPEREGHNPEVVPVWLNGKVAVGKVTRRRHEAVSLPLGTLLGP